MRDQVELLLDLRGLRKAAGMPLEQVVKLSGVCKSNYERLQKGATPSLDNALKLARFLQLPVEQIWRLSPHGRGPILHPSKQRPLAGGPGVRGDPALKDRDQSPHKAKTTPRRSPIRHSGGRSGDQAGKE